MVRIPASAFVHSLSGSGPTLHISFHTYLLLLLFSLALAPHTGGLRAPSLPMNHIRGALRRRGGRNASPMPDPTLSLGERGRSPGWLSRMHRSNSSSKRSASPASPVSVSNPSSRPPTRSSNMEGASSGKPVVPEPEPALESPTMPLFLRLTRAGMYDPLLIV